MVKKIGFVTVVLVYIPPDDRWNKLWNEGIFVGGMRKMVILLFKNFS